jgi:hypothetical protein
VSWTQERARVASLTRSRSADDPDLLDARRALAAARLADYITRTVAAAPPLTDAQRSQLALLLRTTDAEDRDSDGLTGDQSPRPNRRAGRLAQQDADGQQ